MNTRRKSIYSALPVVAATYGENYGVKVAMGHDTAYTDGKTIVVPNVPEDYEHIDCVWGYLTHEAAHVRFTDFEVLPNLKTPLQQRLFNTFEDTRIERGMIERYPGAAYTLHETAKYMLQAGHYVGVTHDDPPASIIDSYSLFWLQSRLVGQTVLEPLVKQAENVARDVLPSGVRVRLASLLRRVTNLTDSWDTLKLVNDVITMLEEEQEKQQNQSGDQGDGDDSQQGQGGDQGDGDDSQQRQGNDQGDDDDGQQSQGNDQGDDDDSQQNQGGDQGDGDDSQQNQGGDQGDGDDSQQSQDNAGTNSQRSKDGADAGGEDQSQLVQSILDADADDFKPDAHASLKNELTDAAVSGDNKVMTVPTPRRDQGYGGNDLYSDVQSVTAQIRQQLYGLVQATQQRKTRIARTGKRVNAKRAIRLLSGDTRIFEQRANKRDPNTGVHLLVDMSSSMNFTRNGGKLPERVAKEAALALALALETIKGVNPGVTYFLRGSSQPVQQVVRHGERVQSQLDKFTVSPSGTTPMAEGIWFAGYELSRLREERKLIIVVTDGEPDDSWAVRDVVERCKNGGIELIGIGIKSNSVRSLFENNIVIDDVNELRATLFGLMSNNLALSVA